MPKLLFLGGPPAVGKTTVAPILAERLAPCAWLEADDVWRIFPWEVTPRTRALVESNVVHVLGRFLEARYEHVLLTWVLHREDLIERLLAPLRPLADSTLVVHLTANGSVLRRRLAAEPTRGRLLGGALAKLSQIEALPYTKVDTSGSSPAEVADQICGMVRAP
jgi:broad-specificity NMP kinase